MIILFTRVIFFIFFLLALFSFFQSYNEENQVIIAEAAGLTIPDFNFSAVGDWGCSIDAKNTLRNIIDKEPDLVLALGDLSYRDTADCWFKIIKPIDKIIKIAIGNHDISSDSLLNAYFNYFNLSKPYYSFDYLNIHFVILSTETLYQVGSDQYTFVINDLSKAASDPDIDWIIVGYHSPAYIPQSTIKSEYSFKNTYHPLFDKFEVDLVLQAHLHAYQRSYPILYNNQDESNPIMTTNNQSYYNDPNGEIFIIVGTAGGKVTHSTEQSSFIAAELFETFGILNVEITNNGKTLTGRFYDNRILSNSSSIGNVLDEFVIRK